ncbi:MAG: 5'/3'-nucleotidase SurE [bacterium]|nr:5'/3'-nucleotidase SurE [bacterium]
MRILITNDDGIFAKGIRELVVEFSKTDEVYVVAPKYRVVGVGGGVTFDRPLKIEEIGLSLGEKKAFSVSGTPADCVILAIDILVKELDIVISGINDEPNVGDDIRFSGTIGACREAAFSGIPSIGVSLEYGDRGYFYEGAVRITRKIVDYIKNNPLPEGVFLNINVPNVPIEEIRGIRFVRLGRRRYRNRVHTVFDPYGREYFWIGGIPIKEEEEDTEDSVLRENYIAITPLKVDETDYSFLGVMKKWKIE